MPEGGKISISIEDNEINIEVAGMNDHVSKPVDIEKLEEALRRWIKR